MTTRKMLRWDAELFANLRYWPGCRGRGKGGQLAPTAPSAASGFAAAAGPPATTPSGKVPLTGVDMRLTYTNPINLPSMEVRSVPSAMAPTDAAVANSTGITPILAKPQWVEADGRTLVRQSKAGFAVVSENASRTAADFSPVNVDGTIYLYASGSMLTLRQPHCLVYDRLPHVDNT